MTAERQPRQSLNYPGAAEQLPHLGRRGRREVRHAIGHGGVNTHAWSGVPRDGSGLHLQEAVPAPTVYGPTPEVDIEGTAIIQVDTPVAHIVKERIDPLGTVRLSMFQTQPTPELVELVRNYAGPSSDTLAVLTNKKKRDQHATKRRALYFQRHPGATIESYIEFKSAREARLEQRRQEAKICINRHVNGLVQQELGLATPQLGAEAYQRHRQIANKSVLGHAQAVFLGATDAELRDEVKLKQAPSDLLELALKVHNVGATDATDPVLEYELRRQFVKTVISLQQERGTSPQAEDKLTQFLTMLDAKFYTGETGKTTTVNVYARFDNETNALIDQPFYDEPVDPAASGTHYKKLSLPTRATYLGPRVLTLTDTKDPSTRKPERTAQSRLAKGEGDEVRADDVEDNYRMKIVVLDNKAVAEQVAAKILDMAVDPENFSYFEDQDFDGVTMYDDDGNPMGIPLPNAGDLQIGSKCGIGKAKGVDYIKIITKYKGVSKPLKITVQSIDDYLTQTFEVGTYNGNPDRPGEYSGRAWELYSIHRELPTVPAEGEQPLDLYYPSEYYAGFTPPYANGYREPHPPLAAKANELLQDKVFTVKTDDPLHSSVEKILLPV